MEQQQKDETGQCVVCGRESVFRFDPTIITPQLKEAWGISDRLAEAFNRKESMFCSNCGCSLRIRRLAAVLMQTFSEISGLSSKSFAELLENKEFRDLKIAEINACGALHSYLKDHPNLYYSEWLPHREPGEVYDGVRCEDLQCLTYPDDSFDIILTSETLEHVPDPGKAWQEIFRTLKDGGYHIFTIPVLPSQPTTVMVDEEIPVPPLDMIYLVVGTRDVEGFIEGGKKIAHQGIVNALNRNNLDLNNFQAILDFGCGCGRLMRHWKYLTKPRLYGSDYNAVLIDWCKNNLRFAEFHVNSLEPPLNYSNGQFEFIFCGSVFTHFHEVLQFAWLDELWRVLMMNGYLMITVHGEYYAQKLPPELHARFCAGEYVAINQEQAGQNACGAYHSAKYIREKVAPWFTFIDHIPMGWDTQDIVLLQKRIF